MAYYYAAATTAAHHGPATAMHGHGPAHNHHGGGRSRRAPRLATTHNQHKPFRGVRSMKELSEAANVTAFRLRFEAGRSFDLDDDLEFCPGLLTEDDLHSIHSSSSDRSSLSSGSPESSPMPHQIQPTPQLAPTFSLSSASPSYTPASFSASPSKLVDAAAVMRTRNAIPIVNPSTGMRVASPPRSISPAHMQASVGRAW